MPPTIEPILAPERPCKRTAGGVVIEGGAKGVDAVSVADVRDDVVSMGDDDTEGVDDNDGEGVDVVVDDDDTELVDVADETDCVDEMDDEVDDDKTETPTQPSPSQHISSEKGFPELSRHKIK